MADQVLLTADRNNVEDCIDLAVEYGLGIEVMAFAYPDVLDNSWRHELAVYRSILKRVPGPITVHGPFMDMVSGSPDYQINQVCIQRYQHAVHISAELGAKVLVLHANFIGSLHNVPYRAIWHKNNVPFWNNMAEFARENGMIIALENMFEFDPGIIGDLLRDVNHPNLRATIDVGHAHIFGDAGFKIEDWIDTMAPWLVHTHMNNNNGVLDEHHGFDWEYGVLNYNDILPLFRALEKPPTMVLEMYQVEDMRNSLYYFELEKEKPPIG